MRLMPSSTYTQLFTPNTRASFTPTNNKSTVKNVQSPSQRTGAIVGGDAPKLLERLFAILKAPQNVKPLLDSNDITQGDYHSWALEVVKFYGAARNPNLTEDEINKLQTLWDQLAAIIDPNKHKGISPLNIKIDAKENKATLSVLAANAPLFRVINMGLDPHIRSGVVDLKYPNAETTTVSVKLTGNPKSDFTSICVFEVLLGRILH